MKKHLIVASYDGISTHYCGVGTIIRNTVRSLLDFAPSENLKVSLAFVSTDPEGTVFNMEAFNDSINLVTRTGGHFIPLCNGTKGYDESDMWKSFPEWKSASASLATSINILLDTDEEAVVMLHDTPFLLFSKYKQQIFDRRIRAYYLPHSSGVNHAFGNDIWREERIKIENECFQLIEKDPNSRVLAEGVRFGAHLIKDYEIKLSEEDYLTNGLYFGQYKGSHERVFENNNAIRNLGIDIKDDSRIIFSWGRGSVAKGLKELAEAWRRVADQLPNHYLIVQAPNNSGEDEYCRILMEYSKTIPRTLVIDNFNPQIWQTVLRSKNTDIVSIPSLMDPNPHTAIEAKFFMTGMNYVVIGSKTDGVVDSYSADEAFLIDPRNVEEFSKTILNAVHLSGSERKTMLKKNAESLPRYDYSKKLAGFLKRIELV